MLRSIVSHLTGALLVIPLCLCQNAPRECSVTFRLIDRYGTPVPFKVSEFKDTGEQVEYAERFEGDTGRVPCGFYAYALTRLDDAAFPKLRGRLEALRPESWMTLATNPNLFVINGALGNLSFAAPPGYVFRGRVLNAKSGARLWVKLQSAFSEQSVEVRPDPDGEFRLYWLPRGQCLLYVVDDTEGLYAEFLTIRNMYSRETLVIDLAQPPPTDRVIR